MRIISALLLSTFLLLNSVQGTSDYWGDDPTYFYTNDIDKLKDVKIIEVHFKSAFRGADQDIATVDSIRQLSDSDPSRIIYISSDDEEFTTGTPLKLKEGYELEIMSIDIDSDRVYVRLLKDGEIVDSAIVFVPKDTQNLTYSYKSDNVKIIEVHFKSAFRGADQDIATVDSILQVSYTPPYNEIYNTSDNAIFTSGVPLKLKEGYELQITAIDLDGDKVYLGLIKDGKTIDSAVVVPPNIEDPIYTYKLDNIKIIDVHFKSAFRSADQDIATVDSIRQVSDSDPSRVIYMRSDEEEFTTGTPLKLKEGYELEITSIDILGDKVYVQLIKDGKTVDSAIVVTPETKDKDGIYTYIFNNIRTIEVHFKNAFRGADQDVVTVDSIRQVSDNPPYNEIYNISDNAIFTSGMALKLKDGYELEIASIDLDNDKVHVQLIKDGEIIDSAIVVPPNIEDPTYTYKSDNIKIIDVHFKSAFRGADQDIATVDSIRQVSDTIPSITIYNSSTKIVFTSGNPLKLEEGYELALESINLNGDMAFVKLYKNNREIDSAILPIGELSRVQASEIKAKMMKGEPIEYDSVIIEGNMVLRDPGIAEEPKPIISQIKITDSFFEGDVYFRNAIFHDSVNFLGTYFQGDADFKRAKFNGDSTFGQVWFVRGANFWGTVFSWSYADFSNTWFSGYADFSGAEFSGGYADFSRARVSDGYADFSGAEFSGGDAYFDETEFSGGDAYFDRAEFSGGDAYFDETEFSGGDAYFDRAEFSGGDAYFDEAEFKGIAQFSYVAFSKSASFKNVQYRNRAYLNSAIFNGSTSFEDAQFGSNAYFENTAFGSVLNLNRTGYNRLFLRWNSINNSQLSTSDYDAYLALMRNYVNLGWFEDSNNCYYEYRNKHRMEEHICIEKGTDTIEWLLYGYGVKPFRPLGWIIGLVMAFGLVFRNGESIKKYTREKSEVSLVDGQTASDKSEAVEQKTTLWRGEINFKDPFLFSLTTFTSGLTSFLYPSIEYEAERHTRLVIVERLLGSVFLALLITAISRTYLIR
jgi:uncharacterized protein YjbI with pentapeptide repeats